jgi:pyrimidine-specific ribonucleoside hydrolase
MTQSKMHCVICISLVVIAISSACSQTPDPVAIEPSPSVPVILDTDMAHEDMFAALYLLQHPHAELKAITVAGTGEAHCGPGVLNALGILTLAGKPALPVACGRELPLAGDHTFPESWRQAADSAYGVPLPENPKPPSDLPAPELIAEVIRQSPEKVVLVAIPIP